MPHRVGLDTLGCRALGEALVRAGLGKEESRLLSTRALARCASRSTADVDCLDTSTLLLTESLLLRRHLPGALLGELRESLL